MNIKFWPYLDLQRDVEGRCKQIDAIISVIDKH